MLQTKKRNSFGFCLFLMLMSIMLMAISIMPITARAETQAETVTETEVKTPQEIIDNTIFLTYKKGDNPTNGKFIISCFYMPEEFYVEDYTYGIVLCPKDYVDRFIVNGDYLNEFEEQGVAISNIVAEVNMETPEGRIFRCGITNIYEQNLDRTFSFIFYAQDGDGNISYASPEYADYNSLKARDYSNDELLTMLGQRLSMDENFQSIIDKLAELVDSIWIYLVIAFAGFVVIGGVYVGVRIIVANKKEEKIDARNMLKGLFIGIIVMFVLAMAMPLLIKGLAAWL